MFPEDQDREIFLFGILLWAVAILLFVSLNGCASPQPCARLIMPPVSNDVVLIIKGDKITANDGGDTMLRGYVRARQLLK
jgi:hypothetical protein